MTSFDKASPRFSYLPGFIARQPSHQRNTHRVVCEQRLHTDLCIQMKPILTGLPMYTYWHEHVFVYVGELR